MLTKRIFRVIGLPLLLIAVLCLSITVVHAKHASAHSQSANVNCYSSMYRVADSFVAGNWGGDYGVAKVTLWYSDACNMNFARVVLYANSANGFCGYAQVARAASNWLGHDLEQTFNCAWPGHSLLFDSPMVYSPYNAASACFQPTSLNAASICTSWY